MKNTGTIRSPRSTWGTPRSQLALESARYATLNNRAAARQAKQLVDHVFVQVARANGSERPTGAVWENQATAPSWRRGVLRATFCGLLDMSTPRVLYTARSMPEASPGEDVGARAFNQLIDRLKALGLIEHARGFQDRFRWEAGGPEVVGRERGRAALWLPLNCCQLAVRPGPRALDRTMKWI